MSNRSAALVMLAVFVFLSGCSAITGSTPDDRVQHRLVVENGYAEATNITVTIVPHKSGPAINETRRLTPDEQWVVTTLDEPVTNTDYTMTVSTEQGSIRHETGGGGTGATLIVIGGGRVVTCGGNLTCYNETA